MLRQYCDLPLQDAVGTGWGFQQYESGASDLGGALAVGHIILALNTLDGKNGLLRKGKQMLRFF